MNQNVSMISCWVSGLINCVSVIIISSLALTSQNNYDFEELKIELNTLGDSERLHQRFLEKLLYRDQRFRGGDSQIVNDHENLVLASLYYNKYGYSQRDYQIIKGGIQPTLCLIWIHNWIGKNQSTSFPIILDAFREGFISDHLFSKYYLLGLYIKFYDQNDYSDYSTQEIIRKLKPNVTDKIDITKLESDHNDYMLLLAQQKECIGLWATAEYTKDHVLPEGGIITQTIDSKYVEIVRYKNTNYIKMYSKNWVEYTYKPVKLLSNNNREFRIFDNETAWYEIASNNDLIYRSSNGSIIKQYSSVGCE